jgi:hypothetical protein
MLRVLTSCDQAPSLFQGFRLDLRASRRAERHEAIDLTSKSARAMALSALEARRWAEIVGAEKVVLM